MHRLAPLHPIIPTPNRNKQISRKNLPMIQVGTSVEIKGLQAKRRRSSLRRLDVPKLIVPNTSTGQLTTYDANAFFNENHNFDTNFKMETDLMKKASHLGSPNRNDILEDHNIFHDNKSPYHNLSHSSNDIQKLIKLMEALRNCISYQLTETKCNQNNTNVISVLSKIIELIRNDAIDLSPIKDDELTVILDCLMAHVNHPYDHMKGQHVPIGETMRPLNLTNFTQLSKVYELFACLLEKFVNKFNTRFFRRLLSVFQSPVREEHALVSGLFHKILNSFPCFLDQLYTQIMQILSDADDDTFSPNSIWCYKPLLELLASSYYNSAHYSQRPEKVDDFKYIIFPLIKHDKCQDFYQVLCTITKTFCNLDCNASLYCVQYLFAHWPVTSSSKQMIYLHQTQTLLSMMSIDMLPEVTEDLLHYLLLGLESFNHTVSLTTLNICNDMNFLSVFVDSPKVKSKLFRAISNARHNIPWDKEIENKAMDAATKVMSIHLNNSIKSSSSLERMTFQDNRLSFGGWDTIRKMAQENMNELDIARITEMPFNHKTIRKPCLDILA
ncbi:hypothetical protein TRFO_11426 [Tritrichomonas foetus]|uniref:Phosphoprotein phosphatase n=1 Tax=Tritrichomonas foetus TaxID=1144522 RepID=A0A1J4J5L6_9EUKA|nr:hypothetical protein TRFO_11426 [Tritrichomonas foetus]|eukprot:OHS93961.1 hypothetical protein TRFO_11426 [Tritrichomonas foetus]